MEYLQRIQQFLELEIGDTGIGLLSIVIVLLILLATKVVSTLTGRFIRRQFATSDDESQRVLLRGAGVLIWLIGAGLSFWWLSFEVTELQDVVNYPLLTLGDAAISLKAILLLIFTLIFTAYVAKMAPRLADREMFRKVDSGPRYTMIRLVQYLIWVAGVFLGLRLIHVDLTSLAVVAGALGLGIGFGLQEVVANFVAGLVLLFERPIRVDDFVTSDSIEGRIEQIRFRSTVILTNDNISIIVPNSQLTNNTVVNWSHNDPKVRLHMSVGVAYGSDTKLVTESLLSVARDSRQVLDSPAPQVWFTEFGDSSLNFELLAWCGEAVHHNRIKSELNFAIDRVFRQNNIQIPFPQRDLHLRSAEVPISITGSQAGDRSQG